MRRSYGFSIIAAAGLCLLATTVLAQFPPVTDPNKDEVKCETGTGKALTKFIGAKAKCISKCLLTARKTSGPYVGCFAPYADPATNFCIFDPLKGAEGKARASIKKACAVDCPECYTSLDPNLCTTGDPLLSNSQTQTNLFGPVITCLEFGGTTPTQLQAKCEDGTGKAILKFIASKSKCFQKCNQNIIKGLIAQGSCTPPVTDEATIACISAPLKGVEAKAAAAIDKVCTLVSGATPPCWAAGLDSGPEWVTTIEGSVDTSVPTIACGM